MTKFSIASVNMRRRNAAMHALLATNEDDDIILVQEPWWGQIGTRKSDEEPEGKKVVGGAAHPKWELHYPYHTEGTRAKVMAYARIHSKDNPFRKNPLLVVNRLDLASHPCVQILDVRAGREKWRIINVYNDVDDPSAFNTLTSLDLLATIPTVVVGDFNLHSLTWSPPDLNPSSRAQHLEEWAATNTLELLTTPGVPTRRGEGNQRDTTIDLTWCNFSASLNDTFVGAIIDWEGSLGSDHALVRTLAYTQERARPPREARSNCFDLDMDGEELEAWQETLKARAPVLRGPPRSTAEIDTVVDLLYEAILSTSSELLKKKGANPARAAMWWNDECKAAASLVKVTPPGEDKAAAYHSLKTIIRRSKREWANKYITWANVWDVVQWRHGRRMNHVLALRLANGELSFEHEEMADALSERFFTEEREPIPLVFADDPPPVQVRPFPPLTEEEVERLLKTTANKTAPGPTGVGWQMLKWAWPVIGSTLTNVFDACVHLGHHPARWREAMVVVIPKPDKPDYTLPKAHRPISLLECMSKLLEKVIANRIQHDITKRELIPTTQFGGRQHSSCSDAGLALLHDIQEAHRQGLKCAVLLFDVKGFFDHVNHGRLVSIARRLGFDRRVTAWIESFLQDRKVRLKFNNILAEERGQPVGVPQGSPISPVLSVMYTSPLLHLMQEWSNSSLGMYVDDGILFACARDWEEVTNTLRSRYATCMDWLRRAGLAIEPDKTELMFFQRPRERNPAPRPSRILLPDPDANTYYVVRPVETLRYLGFFFHFRLNWEHHVRTMANRACASLKVMTVLGNSIRGLSMANWRLAFNAVCLPVMTYGSLLWYKRTGTKKLVNLLQRVQNEGVKVITGAFRTAPREALLQLTRMIPMRHFLEKLSHTSALCLYRLPRASQLLKRLGPQWYAPRPGDIPLPIPPATANIIARKPTSLEGLAARIPAAGPRVDVTAIPPWEVPIWDDRVSYMGVINPQTRKRWTRDLHWSAEGMSIAIVHVAATLTNEGREDGRIVGGAAASVKLGTKWGDPPTVGGWTMGERVKQFDVDCFGVAKTIEALSIHFADTPPPEVLYILSPSSSALQAVKNPCNKSAQSSALLFHQSLTSFFTRYNTPRFVLVWTPRDEEQEEQEMARNCAANACKQDPPNGMAIINSAAYQKDIARVKAFDEWALEWRNDHAARATGQKPRSYAFEHTLTRPPDGNNHALWSAAVEMTKDDKGKKTRKPIYTRRVTSTAFQIAVDHAFTGTYVTRFRTNDPPENARCPCGVASRSPQHITHQCYRFTWERVASGISYYGKMVPFRKIFGPTKKNASRILRFIQESGAFTRPEIGRDVDNIPLEPD